MLSHRQPRRRNGTTLVEVVVSIAILAVFGTVILINVEGSARTGGEAKRIADAARTLERLRDGAVRYNFGDPSLTGLQNRNVSGDTSFTSKISGIGNLRGGINPSKLSQLTNKITSTDQNSCLGAFTTYANWTQNYFMQPLAVGGTFKVADGFVANDQLVRFNPAGAQAVLSPTSTVTGAGTLAIVMPNVALSDAQALATLMEGDRPNPLGSGIHAVVRFTASGDAPVTVYYHMAIHGC